MPGRRIAIVLLAALALAPRSLRAQGDDVRTLAFSEDGTSLLVSGTFTDVFDRDLLEQLSSGFAQTVWVQMWVRPAEGGGGPIWFAAATYRAVYAVWDEVYLVRLRDPAGERNLRFASRAEALKALTTLASFPVAPLSVIPAGPRFFLDVVVAVNPVGPELLADVRRWISRPRGGQIAGDASFFGSFVSVFVNPKLSAADRTLHFRSQDFYRVAAEPKAQP